MIHNHKLPPEFEPRHRLHRCHAIIFTATTDHQQYQPQTLKFLPTTLSSNKEGYCLIKQPFLPSLPHYSIATVPNPIFSWSHSPLLLFFNCSGFQHLTQADSSPQLMPSQFQTTLVTMPNYLFSPSHNQQCYHNHYSLKSILKILRILQP